MVRNALRVLLFLWTLPLIASGVLLVTPATDPLQQNCSRFLADFTARNPELADWIAKQKQQYGLHATAVATRSCQGPSSFDTKAAQSTLRLTAICMQDGVCDETALYAHGAVFDALQSNPRQSEAFLQALENSRNNASQWSLVRNDPIALSSEKLRNDPAAAAIYGQHHDWFHEMLEVAMEHIEMQTPPAGSIDGVPQLSTSSLLDDLLADQVTRKSRFMRLVPHPNQTPEKACVCFAAFRDYGNLIHAAADEGVPVEEVTDVVIQNRDFLGEDGVLTEFDRQSRTEKLSETLVQMYRQRPSVWEAARSDSFVLHFDSLVPAYSQSILHNHPDLGIASLIATQYGEVAHLAAAIVDRYGELGAAILNHYCESELFAAVLKLPDVDYRVAMIAILERDAGLEAVRANPAYLNKMIDENGKPRTADWWEHVPLAGGIANVARNYAKGYPSAWSEIGWAAWDVADAALITVSFGTSKVVTTAAKHSARSIGRKAAARLTATARRTAVATAHGTGLGRLLARAKQTTGGIALQWTAGTVLHLGSSMLATGHRVSVLTARSIRSAKSSLPPGLRKYIARGVLAASLIARTPQRVEGLSGSVQDAARSLTAAAGRIPTQIANAMSELQSALTGNWQPWLITITRLTLALALCSGLLLLYPLFQKRRN
ncbi:MAG: hypothetical protein ACK5TX_13685 [Planctomyces sp.]|jgi:hypothetical protein